MKKAMNALLISSMLLAGCSSSDTSYDPKVFNDYAISSTDYSTLNYLYSFAAVDFQITANLVDGLVEQDNYGNIVPSLAESWEHNEDYTQWTFHLREGVQWMTSSKEVYAEVTADDFVYSAEFILDPAETSNNLQSYTTMIEGAQEYYDAMAAWRDGGSVGEQPSFEGVGVKALDQYTVQYTMSKPVPYFTSVCCYAAFYPANRQFVESMSAQDDGTSSFGNNKDNFLYCGAFILDELTPGSIRRFSKNENYWDVEDVHFDQVNVLYYRDQESIYEAFTRGEASYAPLLTTQAQRLYDEESEYLIQKELDSGSYVIFMNNRTNYSEDTNAALSNVNFRRSLFYGIDRDMYNEVSNPINPESIEAFSYSGRGFVTAPDGTDYLDLGNSKQWQTSQFDMTKAEQYKQQAIEELTAQGVSFPINLTLGVPAGNETRAQQARLLQEAIQALGTDYVTVSFVEYTSATSTQQRRDGEFALTTGGWGPDYADPFNNLASIMTDGTMNNGTTMALGSSHWDYTEFDEMVNAADQITDLQERYTAFANIEAWLNENAYYIPLYQGGGTYIVTSINEFTRPYAPTGIDDYKWKGIVGMDHAVTAEEHEQFRAEYEAGREAAREAAQQYNS
ncbi:Oligopeptide-binding protein SarA precursor [Clostridiales bacterium CHKCI006]|nr:Oligopeptide-binding protein SarA precursor [Clostridiales bacterium CHKCI006]